MKKILYTLAVFVLFSGLVSVQAKEYGYTNTDLNKIKQVAYPSIENIIGHFDNQIKIIFSDIDGTILSVAEHKPKAIAPKSAQEAVKKLRTTGIPLILTTGRVYSEAKEISQKLGNETIYIITQQGAEIRDSKGKLIYADTIKNADAACLVDYIEKVLKENNFTSIVVIYANGKVYSTKHFEFPYSWAKIKVVKSFKDLGPNLDVSAFTVYEPNAKTISTIQTLLKNKFPQYNIDLSSRCCCSITSLTATKGNAVKILAQTMGADLKNAAVLGDAQNDTHMLKMVKSKGGLAIAVGNAMTSVKENANFVTAPFDEDGFAKAVDKILENNEFLNQSSKKSYVTNH